MVLLNGATEGIEYLIETGIKAGVVKFYVNFYTVFYTIFDSSDHTSNFILSLNYLLHKIKAL